MRMAGLLSPLALRDLYSESALGVANLNWDADTETFCCSAVEMLASSLPVFGVARGALPETIGRSGGAFLTENPDLPGAASELVRLLRAPERLDAAGRAGRHYVLEHYALAGSLQHWELCSRARPSSFTRGPGAGPAQAACGTGRRSPAAGCERGAASRPASPRRGPSAVWRRTAPLHKRPPDRDGAHAPTHVNVRSMFHALVACLLAGAPVADRAGATALIDKVIAEYGGAKAIASAHSLRQKGRVTTETRGSAALAREFERPDRLRVELKYPDNTEVRLLSGASAFRGGQSASGPMRDAMMLQAARLDLPALLNEARGRVSDLGLQERGGVALRALLVPLGGSLELTAFVDERSGRILRSEGSVPAGAMGRLNFWTNYSDFRRVKGVLFAFSEENFASGTRTGQTQLETVEIVPALPAATWVP